MTSVSLREMRWWDIPAVAALESVLFGGSAWSTEQFWAELAQPTRAYIVAEDDGRIVGYAGCMRVPPHADIQTIAVADRAQGRGVGTQLVRELLIGAVTAGCTECLLEVDASNAPAITLYQRFGFEQIATRADYYPGGQDALIMRLRPIPKAAT
jgi:ribosomal-protein-alanine N-acetyltransferase